MSKKRCTPEEVDRFISGLVVEKGATIKFRFFTSAENTEPIEGKFQDFSVHDETPGIRLTNRNFYDAERIESGSLEVC